MSQPLRILIVEDEPRWAQAIKNQLLEILNDLGLPCTIEAPSSIRECKEKIRSASETPYDLISLDINFREDAGEVRTDGLKLLEIIKKYSAAWLVSILTGVESDSTVEDTYGFIRTRELQDELRFRACTTFPPERLLVLEKPQSDDKEMLTRRLSQVCMILRQSRVGRNLFRHINPPCLVACHRTIGGDLLKKDSDEFRRAKKAMEFVKSYEDPKAMPDPDKREQYEEELKLDILKKNGKKMADAEWIEDTVSLRQIRFGCGEVITLPEDPNFVTIAWLLRHPGQEFRADQIGGGAADLGRQAVDFHGANPDGADDEEYDDDQEEDDDMNQDRRGEDRDYEADHASREGGEEWDKTEVESRAAYVRDLKKKENELENATGRRREILEAEIEDLNKALGTVRRRPVAGKTHGAIKQHISRSIGILKGAGQVELAEHLSKTIRPERGKFCYNVDPSQYFWDAY